MSWLRTRDIKDSQVTEAKLGAGAITDAKLGSRVMHTQKYTWDFAVGGGAISTITLTSDTGVAQQIPDNAVVLGAYCEVVTPVASSGAATLEFGITGDTDYFLGTSAKTLFDADGKVVKMEAATVPSKMTAAKSAVFEIKTVALTAGKLNVWVRYYQGD
tara:strand:+ start:146 stop:622 length:477 start_codon:yes stop_codon:yes gene_type:complete